jgi:pimeloyl-ACP methyl ester carboxylesterase
MPPISRFALFPLVVLLAFATLAAAEPTTQPDSLDVYLPIVSSKGPLLMHLPGIGGVRMCDHRMLAGLHDGGAAGNFLICDWTENNTGIAALQGYVHNRQQAKQIADLIAAHAAADPASPIVLTAHSGGCGLAVWALEDLPPGVKVRELLLLAPALSPTYDLSAALRHVEGKAYVFSSTLDTVVLWTGTRLFGTIDGVQTAAAGFGGFIQPPHADAELYKKLVPCPYQQEWQRYNDFGEHIGAMSRPFARAILAPLVVPALDPTTRPSDEADTSHADSSHADSQRNQPLSTPAKLDGAGSGG